MALAKLKCPNCGQIDKGFLEFVPVQFLDNKAMPTPKLQGLLEAGRLMGLLCRAKECGMFGPDRIFEVDADTGDCVGRMPDDPY